MPAHDKDGFIEGMIQIDKKPTYIVSYKEQPHLRVSVKPQNILDWVSPRTLEEFEFAKTQAEDKALRDELLPKIEAREQRKRLREQGIPVKASRVKEAPQGTKSRKRKRNPSLEGAMRAKGLGGISAMAPPSGPGRKRKQLENDEEEQVVYISPRRPSLSTPVKQRRLADVIDFESDDEDSFAEDSTLLDHQPSGSPTGRSKLAIELTRSATTSPDPLSPNTPKTKIPKIKKPIPDFDRRETRSGSISSINDTKRRETRSSSASGPPRRDSIAATSSREARAIYEKLERESKAKAGSLAEKYSYSGKKPSKSTQLSTPASSSRQRSAAPQSTRKKSATPKPFEDDDSEYEVDAILADEYRLDKKGKHVLWYLIKWVGEWPHSWEPEENVGTDAIAEYKEKKRFEQAKIDRSLMTLDGVVSSGDDAMDDEVKGKGKGKVPFGSGGLGAAGGKSSAVEDESDEDELFVQDRSRGPGVGPEIGPSRGQVIDDDGSDEF
jgi:hypothetical protein